MNATAEEIASQPDTWQAAIDRVDEFRDPLVAPGERMLVIGCGTSAFVAQSFAVLRERAGLGETDAAFASELPTGRGYDRVLAICRSGTTTEVLDALASMPPSIRRVAVTGVDGEAGRAGDAGEAGHGGGIGALVDERVLLDFADETSVVQTRFPTTVLALARAAFGDNLAQAVADGRQALGAALPVDPTEFEQFVFLGTGWTVGLAQEAALKVREMAHGWSESYPAMDFRHGPVAATGRHGLVWTFGDVPGDIRAVAQSAGATVHHDSLDPLAQLVVLQRIALRLAEHRGLDPDRPRHLTRSVVLR